MLEVIIRLVSAMARKAMQSRHRDQYQTAPHILYKFNLCDDFLSLWLFEVCG